MPWDSSPDKREGCMIEERPLLVGSPMCTDFCPWQALNNARLGRSPAEILRRLAAAQVHISFVCSVYEVHLQSGSYFLHERPGGTLSWSLQGVQTLFRNDGVRLAEGDQGKHCQETKGGDPVRKMTKWMSNSQIIIQE